MVQLHRGLGNAARYVGEILDILPLERPFRLGQHAICTLTAARQAHRALSRPYQGLTCPLTVSKKSPL